MKRTDLAVPGLHFTLQLAILAAIGGIYWQLSDLRERVTRVETQLQYTLPAIGRPRGGIEPAGAYVTNPSKRRFEIQPETFKVGG